MAAKEGITSPLWPEFLESIKQAREELGNPDRLWYRGHPNSEFQLLATLLPYENGLEKEKELFNKFRKSSDRILPRRQSEWETLFEMQHYGIPTRLLDWSETFGIALFFAAMYNETRHPGADAAIYLLNPITHNRISGIDKILRAPEDEKDFGYTKIYWSHSPFAATAPIAIEPVFLNDRMLAQRGMFTFHHDKIDPLEKEFPTAIKKVIVPNALMAAALEFLELSNLTMFSIFPDLAGLSRFLMGTCGLKSRW